jgi:TnpA family transposase
MLRVAGSLTTGQVRAYDLIRMMTRDGRPTGLGEAFTHYGRIFKTLDLLQVLHDESYRRMSGSQLNLHESRHALARRIRHGHHGQLHEHYRQGMENQLGALDATALWNTLYIDKAVAERRAPGRPVAEELLAGPKPADLRPPQLQRPLFLPPPRARRAQSPARPRRRGRRQLN